MTNRPSTISTPCTKERAAAHIARLFLFLQFEDKGIVATAAAAEFLEAVKMIPEWAIEEAAKRYRGGQVGDGKFVPQPGEFAITARSIADREYQKLRAKQALADQFEEDKRRAEFLEAKKNPGTMEKFKAAMNEWKAAHSKHQEEAKEADAEYQRQQAAKLNIRSDKRPLAELTHERFADQGRAAVLALADSKEAR